MASFFIAGSGSAQLADPNGWEDNLDSGLDSIASFNASDIPAPDYGLSDAMDGSWRAPDGGDFDDFNNGLTGAPFPGLFRLCECLKLDFRRAGSGAV